MQKKAYLSEFPRDFQVPALKLWGIWIMDARDAKQGFAIKGKAEREPGPTTPSLMLTEVEDVFRHKGYYQRLVTSIR